MADNNWEVTKHYGGKATVTFKPGAHGYWVDDPDWVNPETGEVEGKKNARTGGGTSLTGTLAKGQGLMLWPMWEMSKHLKTLFESTPLMDLIDDPDYTIESILKAGRDAHVRKSDLGKSVGTSAHAWVEEYSNNLQASQKDSKVKFVLPKIPEVEDIAKVLRAGYLRVINDLKPKEIDEWKRLPKLIFKEIEIQEAIWKEATMIRNSILGAKAWLEMHDIVVHGAEDTVYSRKLFVCGKYDADWEVTCSGKCGLCYLNGDEKAKVELMKNWKKGDPEITFTGRYIVDFKSSNASNEQPKGIYPEYLAQCAVYEVAIIEEHPDRKYDGYLILNGSKKVVTNKSGVELPVFNSHFSFKNDQWRRWAELLAENKELIWAANQEMKESNAGIKIPKETSTK